MLGPCDSHQPGREDQSVSVQQLEQTDDELSADDESPLHNFYGDMAHHAVTTNYADFKAYMVLLEHNPYEAAYGVLWNLGRALRETAPTESASESSESTHETLEQK